MCRKNFVKPQTSTSWKSKQLSKIFKHYKNAIINNMFHSFNCFPSSNYLPLKINHYAYITFYQNIKRVHCKQMNAPWASWLLTFQIGKLNGELSWIGSQIMVPHMGTYRGEHAKQLASSMLQHDTNSKIWWNGKANEHHY
jgi:hypothetical protein